MSLRFDDRLRTVLALPATESHDRAVRWRQLVELVARSASTADPDLVQQALQEIRAGSAKVDERVRMAAAAAIAPLPLPVDLVATFAVDSVAVAAPVLASARLTASEWKRVSAGASEECRAVIASMHAEPSAPAPPAPAADRRHEQTAEAAPKAAPAVQGDAVPSISDVVARIERLRQLREGGASTGSATATAEEEDPRLFKWECNEAGEIEWVDGVPRGALVGQSIAQASPCGGVDQSVERAFSTRAPFHDGRLDLPHGGRAGGTWKISGVPAFEPSTGRFAGYRGIAQRPADRQGAAPAPVDPDSLRELAHEIKTPLNAIIGFAEIIAGEYLGPAESRYRERAADIVGQARLLLTAVEDLDLAAKLRSRERGSAAELADALAACWEEVEREAAARGVRVKVEASDGPARCALDPQLAQRLVERLCAAILDGARNGEELTFRIGSDEQCCSIAATAPATFAALDFSPDRNRRASDVKTLPLRLVIGLARTAGGDLVVAEGQVRLQLPKA